MKGSLIKPTHFASWFGLLFVGGFLTAILNPLFLSAKAASSRTNCLSNLKKLALHTELYASDHDHFVDARRWSDTLALENGEPAFTCLKSSGVAFSYAMNAELSGKRWSSLPSPETHLLFFDSKVMVPNAHGDISLLPDSPRHHGGNMGVYVDGHAKPLRLPANEGE
jgi:hypothetical protein